MTTDLTKGNVSKTLLHFSMPMFISVIFQQMYNLADSVIAGRFAGKLALAAVGTSYPVTMIYIAIAMGLSIGVSVIVSRLFGSEAYGNMKTAVNTALTATVVLSSIVTGIGFFASDGLLNLIHTQPELYSDSKLYLDIYTGGLLFLFLYNISTGIFNALGDSKTPLWLLIGSSVLNIGLDLLFVISFSMGVAGVAWATFIAQGASGILAFVILLVRIKKIKTQQPSRKFSFPMLKTISRIAVPSILQQSFVSVGQLFISGLINSLGTDVIAGYSGAIKLNTFVVTCFNTLGNAVSTFTAQNIGAGKENRVQKGVRWGVVYSGAVALLATALFCLFSKFVMQLFIDPVEAASIGVGQSFLYIVSPFYIVVSVKLVFDGMLRGAQAIQYFMISTFSDLLIRVVLSYILTLYLGETGIWISWPVGWIISCLLSFCFYRSNKWLHKPPLRENR